MAKQYIIISPDGTKQFVPADKCPTLQEMQKIVGGYIERVNCKYNGKLCDMIINEEGKLHGLPHNEEATQLFYNLYGTNPDFIVGTVIVLDGIRLR